MELGNQIRIHRTARGLSQEDLAEKIYVSRQTISNWETDRTYPDVQSLLLLSALFDVTIDELVKGDVKTMRETVEANKMNKLGWIMLVCVMLCVALIGPCFSMWGFPGLVLPFALWAVAMVSAVIVDRIKKKNDVKTYSEILAFMEGKPVDREKAARERKNHLVRKTLLVIGFGACGGIIAYVSLMLFS